MKILIVVSHCFGLHTLKWKTAYSEDEDTFSSLSARMAFPYRKKKGVSVTEALENLLYMCKNFL